MSQTYSTEGCNFTHCIDPRPPSEFNLLISCGVVVSEDPENGVKCAHVTKRRGKFPELQDLCEQLSYYNNDTGETVKTGNLITINSMTENNKTRDHYMNVTQVPGGGVYYPYAFIGLRKACRNCNFFWHDNEPLTFTNWYGTDPEFKIVCRLPRNLVV